MKSKKNVITISLVTVILAGVCCGYNLYEKKESVYATTSVDATIDAEVEMLEEVLEQEVDDLEVDDELSSEGNIIYEDEEDNLYQIQDEEVVGFFNCEVEEEKVELTEEQIDKVANEYLNTLVDSKKYTLTEEKYNKYTETYRYYYYRCLGNYKTTEMAYIEVDKFGNVRSFAKPNEGLFDNVDVELITEDEVKQKAVEKSQYNNEDMKIVVDNIMIEKENGIRYCVDLSCTNIQDNVIYTETIYIEIGE